LLLRGEHPPSWQTFFLADVPWNLNVRELAYDNFFIFCWRIYRMVRDFYQGAEESRIFCNFSLWVTLCTNALPCCQLLERLASQICDSTATVRYSNWDKMRDIPTITFLHYMSIGFPPKLISSEFRSEFRSQLVLTFDEIIGRNYWLKQPPFWNTQWGRVKWGAW
jgi:hypothetical protein